MSELVAELPAGTTVGPYIVDELAGVGGSSLVYRATHRTTGEIVALKVGRKIDHATTSRLQREATLLERVDWPGVVGFRQWLLHEGAPVVATQWLDGPNLAECLADEGPLPWNNAVALIEDLAATVDQLHQAGVVHRDLSPNNVIMSDGQPVLIDLGIGRDEDTTKTIDGTIAGTPRYLAPETIRGEDPDGRADQYSLAVMLHELIAGQPPFPDAANTASMLYQQLDAQPEPLSEAVPSTPEFVERAILRALEKNPADRFESVVAFAAAAADVDGALHRAPQRRRWGRLAGAGVAVAALIGGAAAVAVRTTDQPTATSTTEPTTIAAAAGADAPEASGSNDELSAITTPIDDADPDLPTGASTSQATNSTTTEATGATPDTPAPGQAGALTCNLLTVSGFDDGVRATDFFGDPADNERLLPDAGVDGSGALEVGRPGVFGQTAELVAVRAGVRYGFAGWFRSSGEMFDQSIQVDWLDANFNNIASSTVVRIEPTDDYTLYLVDGGVAPPNAAWALPLIFKDASAGALLADELIFAPYGSCADAYFGVET
ncbi:MAG: serine/threonine-protein kinase [Actinomycetota bacterium]